MSNGRVVGIYIAPAAGSPMQELSEVQAIAGAGLAGDRYCTGEGSFNKEKPGNRQVTFINARFFYGTPFAHGDSRRNIVTFGVELNRLVGREFQIGQARFRGVKYCDPCNRPSKLVGKSASFQEALLDAGGLVAEVLESGLISVGNEIITPTKGY